MSSDHIDRVESLARQVIDTAVALSSEKQAARVLATAVLRISEQADEHTATLLRQAIADWSRARHQPPAA